MIGRRYRYIEGGDVDRFAWASEPTYVCEWAEYPPRTLVDEAERLLGEPAGEKLAELWTARHGQFQREKPRDRVDGQLVERCSACGARLERKGFAAWIERPADTSTLEALLASPLEHRERQYFPSRRQAKAWAQTEAHKSRQAAKKRDQEVDVT